MAFKTTITICGRRLAERMLACGRMTQKELSERTGIRPGTISKLYHETTKRLEIEHLDRLCAVLKCQPGDLLEWTEDDKGAVDDKPK